MWVLVNKANNMKTFLLMIVLTASNGEEQLTAVTGTMQDKAECMVDMEKYSHLSNESIHLACIDSDLLLKKD